jgi:hypothetical protein
MSDSVAEETLAAAGATRDPREVVAVTTRGVRVDNERHFPLLRVLVTAAALEATAVETLTRADRVYREALAKVAARLKDLEVLKEGLTIDRATDILWFYLGHQSWRVYVTDCGWSWNETEEWLAGQVSTAVLSDRTT